MSEPITTTGLIGSNYYAVIRSGSKAWNGSAFVTETSTRGDFDIPLIEGDAINDTLARFAVDFPAAIPSGEYSATLYRRSGAAPAETDRAIGREAGYWDNKTETFYPSDPSNTIEKQSAMRAAKIAKTIEA